MARAVDHLTSHYSAGLPLQPGGGKTSITLAAFKSLRAEGRALTMLVLAPLRVALHGWPGEINKWDEFADLKYVVLHGKGKDEALRRADADIYIMNYEGVEWLCHKYTGRPLPFDVIVFDELTRLKNSQSERSKRLRPRLARGPKFRWGLTGSLAGDGNYEDVFGQQLMLDDGAALGKYITHFRDKYFVPGFDGFSQTIKRGAGQQIIEQIAPYWFYMDPADYSQLPPLVDVPVIVELSVADMRHYKKMRDEYVATLPGGVITAANAGGAYAKLAQMANGAVYDEHRDVHKIHAAKIDALADLIEELNGEPVLIGYEFQHDLTRIKERFPDMAHFGGGATAAQEREWLELWNKGKLKYLAGHPASMGHGLNLQGGSARHVCWFSLVWSWELIDQFTRRIRRSGTAAETIFNHMLICKGTIDEDKLAARDRKSFTSASLLDSLNKQILRETRDSRTGAAFTPDMENDEMVAKLSRPAAQSAVADGWGAQSAIPQQAAAQSAAAQSAIPQQAAAGWGAPPVQAAAPPVGWNASAVQTATPPVGWGAPANTNEQREAIQRQIAPTPAEQVSAAFGAGAQSAAASIVQGDYGAPSRPANGAAPDAKDVTPDANGAKRARKPKEAVAEAASPLPKDDAAKPGLISDHGVQVILAARLEVLKIAFADPNLPLEDGLEIADNLWTWVNKF